MQFEGADMTKKIANMTDDNIPNLSVLDYEFGDEHAAALATLLMAGILGDRERLVAALRATRMIVERELDYHEREAVFHKDEQWIQYIAEAKQIAAKFTVLAEEI